MQPYILPFLQFQPSHQGTFLIQLKFEDTHFSASGTIKIHNIIKQHLVKKKMTITSFPITQKAQGLFSKKKKKKKP